MYKAIIFDLDNTLMNYTQSELDSMLRTCRDHSLFQDDSEYEWELFWPRFLEHNFRYWTNFVGGGEVKSIREVLHHSFRDALNKTETLLGQLTDTYWNHFCDSCFFEEGAQQVLDVVHGRYRLGIITNGIGEAQRRRLKAGGIDHMFHSVVVSDEVGVRKPSKEIFEMALRDLNVRREEALFIGDSLTDDYRGSIQAGIDFCYYNREGSILPDCNCQLKIPPHEHLKLPHL